MKPKAFFVDWFYKPPYDIEKIKILVKNGGGINPRSGYNYGWSNQPKVVIFNAYPEQLKDIEKNIEDAFGFEWVLIMEKDWNIRTIDKIITECDCKYGAPMGRPDVIPEPTEIVNGQPYYKIQGTVFDCRVPMCAQGDYDKGGAYWGIGRELRVKYNKALSYVHFYRLGNG